MIWRDSCINSRRNAAIESAPRKSPEQKMIIPISENALRKSRLGYFGCDEVGPLRSQHATRIEHDQTLI